MSSPTISVIIPVYNGERFLAEAIQSVLDQTLPPDEIIVVDDGSTDGSAALVHRLASTSRLPIHYIYQENQGPAAARNHGVQLALGAYIAFLDADDIWDRDKLSVQLRLLTEHKTARLVWGYIQEFKIENQQKIMLGPPHPGPHVGSVLMQRTVFEQVGRYDESMWHGEDLDWFLRSSELGIPALTHRETVLWYRHHANNMWLGRQDTFAHDLIAFVRRRLEHKQ
ncbi:glycosyltransferase family 2 protein [Candidatus Chloroploca sp. M-50]|uniref:Glycosyltransferase family 2 protein n=1 Tax=Candidatus Chloroploca mongolica TaxID=2528176 RepID=A0ABS4D447_9CHLR|nr:glycosyltransferase family A protein [Candidatus Chloroploca mongolica]MBP1464210.1 glycosyltransferase family 2 protein [Candidatus Chloroploca mongolica]